MAYSRDKFWRMETHEIALMIDQSWLTPDVVRILGDQTLMDPEELKVLADALEDAGCRDEEILYHLRFAHAGPFGCNVAMIMRDVAMAHKAATNG
jgi:hypothetical protein